MRKTEQLAAGAVLVVGLQVPAQAGALYFGQDISNPGTASETTRMIYTDALAQPDPAYTGATQNATQSSAARSAFAANFTTIAVERFDDLNAFPEASTNPVASFILGADLVTAQFGTSPASTGPQPEIRRTDQTFFTSFTTAPASINGAHPLSGRGFVLKASEQSAPSTLALDFSGDINAFGFSATDLGDFGAGLDLRFLNDGSLVELMPLDDLVVSGSHPANVPGTISGSTFFAGYINSTQPFDRVELAFLGDPLDGFAFDDLIIGRNEQLERPVPAPGSALLLLSGLLGLRHLRRPVLLPPSDPTRTCVGSGSGSGRAGDSAGVSLSARRQG